MKCLRGITISILIILGGLLGIWIVWRMISRWRSLPCPAWLGWSLDNPLTERVFGGQILDHLDIRSGMRVLDVGCGMGRLSLPAAQRVGPQGQVVALDIQAEMLRKARLQADELGLKNIRFIQAGAGRGAIMESDFDRALLITVLGEIPDREAALEEIFSALKPGGLLAVAELILDPHYLPRATVRRLAAHTGFEEDANYGNRLAYTLVFSQPLIV
jgi:2-polyprenyl-3-methyl-5-hydroxy-6-metoxy-1,4-benzoquinol methylase